ncbi:MAG: hypothetical protein KME55_35555 [Nostoc indistinguendum CM1-VF10]|nr:hypothetical protein [Nostoc indistinguendum CM1-VF10]
MTDSVDLRSLGLVQLLQLHDNSLPLASTYLTTSDMIASAWEISLANPPASRSFHTPLGMRVM